MSISHSISLLSWLKWNDWSWNQMAGNSEQLQRCLGIHERERNGKKIWGGWVKDPKEDQKHQKEGSKPCKSPKINCFFIQEKNDGLYHPISWYFLVMYFIYFGHKLHPLGFFGFIFWLTHNNNNRLLVDSLIRLICLLY